MQAFHDPYRECTLQVYDIQRVIKWEIIYTTRPSVGGTTVGTCAYKTANIKGHALHVALLSQGILTGTDN